MPNNSEIWLHVQRLVTWLAKLYWRRKRNQLLPFTRAQLTSTWVMLRWRYICHICYIFQFTILWYIVNKFEVELWSISKESDMSLIMLWSLCVVTSFADIFFLVQSKSRVCRFAQQILCFGNQWKLFTNDCSLCNSQLVSWYVFHYSLCKSGKIAKQNCNIKFIFLTNYWKLSTLYSSL